MSNSMNGSKETLRKRIPLGAPGRKLYIDPSLVPSKKRPRWINDKDGRIQDAERGGYEFIVDEKGNKIEKRVGVKEDGTALHAYLMMIDKEMYEEDQISKQKSNDEIDKQIKEGTFQQKPDDGRYIPSPGISIKTGDMP